MAGFSVNSVWELIGAVITAIASGSGFVVLIETFRDWLFKRREEFVERTKFKVEITSKAAPYYNQLSMHSWNFAWNVVCEKPEKRDNKRIMWYMCNMLHFREEITKKFGDLQFDNLEAEEIIQGFWTEIRSTIEEEFGYVDISRLICMG